MAKLKIVYRKIDELIPYDNNPRINDKAVDAVAASIKEFGFNVPIVIDADSVIVAGHTRLEAAKILQLSEVPTVSVDSLTDEQVRAYRLADNKTAELAQWDWSKLEDELANISTDMSVYGFENMEFDSEITETKESDFEEAEEQYTVCPSCGLRFVPEFE